MCCAGMLGAVLFTVLFACSAAVPLFMLAWVGNRAVQSLCWAGMVKITGKWFSFASYGTAMGVDQPELFVRRRRGTAVHGAVVQRRLRLARSVLHRSRRTVAADGANWLWLKAIAPGHRPEEPPANPTNVYGNRRRRAAAGRACAACCCRF